MRVMNKLSIGAALFGSVFLAFGSVAQADDYHWDRDHGRSHHEREWREHERHEHEWREWHHAPRFVEERPVYVQPPVVFAPPEAYAPAGPPSLNLNFNVPLQ
jgi:hypothetical protein